VRQRSLLFYVAIYVTPILTREYYNVIELRLRLRL